MLYLLLERVSIVAEAKKTTKKVETEEKTLTGFTMLTEVILVYLVFILGFIFSFMDNSKCSKRAKFVYNQAGAVFIVYLVLLGLSFIPFIGFLFDITKVVLYVFLIIAMVKGAKGEDYKIPGVYELGNAIWGKNTEKKEEK